MDESGKPSVEFCTKISVNHIQTMGSDNHIASAAWVSTSEMDGLERATKKPEDVVGLINYLMANKHGTPFEHASMTFRVHAPILVWREHHRHRIGFSYNEESGRYKKLAPVFYIPPLERPMMKVEGWKPGRPKFETVVVRCMEDGFGAYDKLCDNLKKSYQLAYKMYEANLELGIDPGLARDCLPVGIYSSCWVTCNPRSLMAFLALRTHNPVATHVSYPLWEIEQVAIQYEKFFAANWPITWAAFQKNGRDAP
jgi:thymidylate synthase (FAD)